MDSEGIQAGIQAEFLASNPAFNTVFNALSERLHAAWYESHIEEREKRDQIWLQLKALDAVKMELQSRISAGLIAERAEAQENGE